MSDWNFDMSQAPRGNARKVSRKIGKKITDVEVIDMEKVILAGKCGVVTTSYWVHDQNRWNMFSEGEEPVAWMHFPKHPEATP